MKYMTYRVQLGIRKARASHPNECGARFVSIRFGLGSPESSLGSVPGSGTDLRIRMRTRGLGVKDRGSHCGLKGQGKGKGKDSRPTITGT